TQVACWSGLIVALAFLVISFWFNDSLLLFLAIFIMFTSYQQLMLLERGMIEEGGAFGYDFSKGYAGFGPDEDAPPPKVRRAGAVKRWPQAPRGREGGREARAAAPADARPRHL